mgnify:CR=1 FL=1
MVQTLTAALRRLDEDAQRLLDMVLPAVIVEALGAQRALDIQIIRGEIAGDETIAGGMGGVRGRRIGPQVLRFIGFPHHASIPSRFKAAASRSSTRMSRPSYPLSASSTS